MRKYGRSFYLAFPRRFVANLARFRQAFAAHYPRVTVSYSIKTNYFPVFLHTARDAGYGAEAVSRFEYDLAVRMGFPAPRVVLNGPVKSPQLLATALGNGSLVHLDSEYEVDSLERLAGSSDTSGWRIGLRCNLGLADAPSRFGFEVSSGALEAVARRLRAIPGVRLRGLHAHVATQPKTLAAFVARLRRCSTQRTACSGTSPPEHLDVGSSFCSPAAPMGAPTFDDFAQTAAEHLTLRYGMEAPELVLEPGIAVALDSMSYVCRVLDVKTISGARVAVTTGSVHTVRPSAIEVVSGGPATSDIWPASAATVALGGYTCMEHDMFADFAGPVATGDFLLIEPGRIHNSIQTTIHRPRAADSDSERRRLGVARRADTVEDVLRLYGGTEGWR